MKKEKKVNNNQRNTHEDEIIIEKRDNKSIKVKFSSVLQKNNIFFNKV